MTKTIGKKIVKNVYFSNFNDINYFNTRIKEPFTIFDKEIVVVQSNIEIPSDRNLASFIKNTIVQKELTKTLKDKKVLNMIYILHDSNAESVRNSIVNFISPQINKNIEFIFHIAPADKSTDFMIYT